mmetsp:Transcript_25938/g.22879  ORF Transcript_25938/g.22879 Transcript_25938/m.22879 type:complete len:206 (-) Transcript_25938:876-1493(-)
MLEKKVNTKDLESPSFFSNLTKGFLDIHGHRYFRRSFIVLLLLHMITNLVPISQLQIMIPKQMSSILNLAYENWPLPTFRMTKTSDESEFTTLEATNLIFKSFEILVMLLYTVDLLPKIFVWKKPMWWKAINICIVTVMILQVPLTMYVYTESGMSIDILKIRTLSISISLLLVLEIFSIREQRTIRTSRRYFNASAANDAQSSE